MIPTLFGVMLITFVITQFVPGGPVEQLVAQLTGQDQMTEAGSATGKLYRGAEGIDKERLDEIKALYGFDKRKDFVFDQIKHHFRIEVFKLTPAVSEFFILPVFAKNGVSKSRIKQHGLTFTLSMNFVETTNKE